MNEETHLSIQFNNFRPVELLDLTKSLMAFSSQFQKFIKKTDRISNEGEAVLYIKEIKTGSIIIQLQEMFTQSILPFAENMNTMLDFATYLQTGFNYFLKKDVTKIPLPPEEYKDFSAIIEPIAKEHSSQLNISTVVNGDVQIHFHIKSTEANAIQNIIKNYLKVLRLPMQHEDGILKRQILTFYQARNDPKSKLGNKGTIEEISNKHLNIAFVSDELLQEMIHGETNPFETAYVVDVSIENINNKPAVYKIHKFHQYFNLYESV